MFNFGEFFFVHRKNVPSQFPLWFIMIFLEKKSYPVMVYPLLPLPRLYRNLGMIPG